MNRLELLADFFQPHKPLLIELGALQALLDQAEQPVERGTRGVARDRSLGRMLAAAAGGKDFPRQGECWDGKIDMPGMTIAGDVAEIPIYGLIGDKLDPLAKWYYNATDLRDVNREIAIAESEPAVKRVLFTFDTPGGSSSNLPETSDLIQGMSKQTASFVDNLAASAGFWLAAATGRIAATRGSDVGSIGVYSTFRDVSKLASDLGIKVQVFSSGKYKGAGVPGTSLTPDQMALIQQDVVDLADEFKAHVRASRMGEIPDSAMEGQTFTATKGKELGLIDAICPTPAGALALIR